MEITNPNYNTMPEQVNQNTKDIAVLKNTVKTPAIIYNATVEMAQNAGVINKSNISQQVINTVNAFVMDTVGKLFRIIAVENDQVYVAYCASISGPQGANGADGVGIQSITSIAPTQDNGYTVTPVTFTDTNDNETTLNIRAKNGLTPGTDFITVAFLSSDSVTIGAANTNTQITAIEPDGYKFLCWLQPTTIGWIGSCYIDDVTTKTNATMWNVYGSGGGVKCGYLLIKEL